MDILLILNDGPSQEGRSESALRLAAALLRAEGAVVRVFLSNEAIRFALVGSPEPGGSAARADVPALVRAGAEVAVSDTALRERRIAPTDLVIGAEPAGFSTMAAWCLESDRLMVF